MKAALNERVIEDRFADFIRKLGGDDTAVTAAAAICGSVIDGHICRALTDIFAPDMVAEATSRLLDSNMVGRPGDFRPLILDGNGYLYLHRYWKYEHELAIRLLSMVEDTPPLDGELLASGVARLFASGEDKTDWQRVAALAAVRSRFCVISGGPGTGKTTTVKKIISLVAEQAKGERFRIALAAPTGKAAARLREALLAGGNGADPADSPYRHFPGEVHTIHRLLGTIPGSARFRHNAANPLPYELVLVDEASMVPLPMMAKLVAALPPGARLILLGDRDQLASVEPGAVLGEICGNSNNSEFSRKFSMFAAVTSGDTLTCNDESAAASPLADSVVILRKSYRFHDTSGIGRLSRLVNESNGDEALMLLQGGECEDIRYVAGTAKETFTARFKPLVVAGYGPFLGANDPLQALTLLDDFRVLCAVRQGHWGVTLLNRQIEEILTAEGLISPVNRWYSGRPVMVTVNDYAMKLFNGDIGICLPDQDKDGEISVYFPTEAGSVRKVSPVRLPEHETVFAMTVHKSQGSEFESVLLVLPDGENPVLTRELVYTGITRARKSLYLWSSEDSFRSAVSKTVRRSSGLGRALWGGNDGK